MILALKNGKLIPPSTPAAGHKRALALAAECARIEEQLRDPNRRVKFNANPLGPSFENWHQRAEQALRMHNMELRLLTDWLDAQGGQLMKKVAFLLGELIKDEVEFNDDELNLIEEFVAYVRDREKFNAL